MAKIDTSTIAGYADMTPEQKLAALEAFEYEDHAAELERQKSALSRANSDAAEWKRKHNALLNEDERKKQEDTDKLASMQKELDELRKEKTVSEYATKYMAQGYEEALALSTAKALADGDTEAVFANQKTFLERFEKSIKAEAMKNVPKPPAGGGTGAVDYAKKIAEAQAGGDFTAAAYYTRLQAQEAAAENP